MYQDQWLNGAVSNSGKRECALRYEVIRDFVARKYADRPFSVCDIGASMCYFGLRLTEDFPACTVMAFEYRNPDLRVAHLKANKAERIMFCGHKLTLQDLRNMAAFCRFDVVLALSVIHHLPGNIEQWLKAIRALGINVIAEFATSDSPRTARCPGYLIPHDAMQIGSGDSHLSGTIKRPIVLLA